jgi:AraC-like DNA-binding protein
MYHDYANRVRMNNLQTTSKVISKCKGFIKKHLYEKIYLDDLSKNMNLNPTYLSHIFKKETGISISEYILSEKINEAKKLITSPEYTLADVYEMLNFQDQSYFTKVFKRFTGITPKKYKILNKEL